MNRITDTFKLNNGVEIPCMGLGTWQSKDEIAKLSVLAALSHDYRLIDTAAAYGNECGVGLGIKESGLEREKIFVTSKLRNADHGYKSTLNAFEHTLERLGLEYLDLYLIHWSNPVQYRYIWKEAMQETWRAFEELYKAGKIRAIGVSNFMPHHIEALMETAKIKPMVNQLKLCPGITQHDTVEYCRKNDIVVEAYGIDFNDSIIVWKCDFYFDRKIKDYVGKGFMLQPTTAGGYAGGAGINHNTQFRNGNANDSIRYEFMYISTFDDENSVGNRTVLCDEWHSMTQVYDAKSKKISTYIDGQIVAINQRVNAPLSDRSVYGLQLHSPTNIPENVIYFDNIEHYVMAKRPGIEAYTYNPISGVVTIEFATPIDNTNLNKFTMTKNGEDAGMLIKSRMAEATM